MVAMRVESRLCEHSTVVLYELSEEELLQAAVAWVADNYEASGSVESSVLISLVSGERSQIVARVKKRVPL